MQIIANKHTEIVQIMIEFKKLQALAQAVIQTEADAIAHLSGRIDQTFFEACKLIMQCKGRVVVLGMGKSGHIGNKIAATLASTGTPAFFVHPGEASHGDLGMITSGDIVIAISYSGKTQEVLNLLPVIKLLNVKMISLTGNKDSDLASYADVNLDVSVSKEACPMNLTPTSSTTATLVMGDALAIALLQLKEFTKDDFARSHPGGSLGKRLLLRVSDIMHTGEELPTVNKQAYIKDALVEMSKKGFGATAVLDDDQSLLGIFTDGDLRRFLDKNIDIHTTQVNDAIHAPFVTIKANALAAEALRIMEDKKITLLIVLNSDNKTLQGIIHMHDVLQSGLI